jgi:hypothetical protein
MSERNEVTVGFDPEVIEAIARLIATVDLYVAHTENLIERVRVLEEGHEWKYKVLCHTCELVGEFINMELANDWAETHAQQGHSPYITSVVRS